jgi:hypothetical protein
MTVGACARISVGSKKEWPAGAFRANAVGREEAAAASSGILIVHGNDLCGVV